MAGPYSMGLRERVAHACLAEGATVEQVAARYSVGTATVKRWAARVRSGEGLVPRKSPGRPREFTEKHDALKRLRLNLLPGHNHTRVCPDITPGAQGLTAIIASTNSRYPPPAPSALLPAWGGSSPEPLATRRSL